MYVQNKLYVVMWESWIEGEECKGGDLFYTHDESKAYDMLHRKGLSEDMDWVPEDLMYRVRYGVGWDKYYVDEREMETEL